MFQPLKQFLPDIIFLFNCMIIEQVMRMKYYFGIKEKINFINIPKFLD
jgi:hypothetical protein